MDKEGALPLTLRRDQLAEGRLPFQMELERDIVIEFIAWIFAFAPRGPVWDRRWANAYLKLCPLVAKQVRVQRTLSWFCSAAGVAPLDRGLLRNLGVRSIVIAGTISMEGIVEIGIERIRPLAGLNPVKEDLGVSVKFALVAVGGQIPGALHGANNSADRTRFVAHD